MTTPLTLARDEAGEFVLPADMLAARFGWSVEWWAVGNLP